MQRINFTKQINASPEKVWQSLWEDSNYRRWTSAFTEGSYAVSDWKQGSSIKFLSPSGEGMYSLIDELIPVQKMAFKHLGILKNGEEQPNDEKAMAWSGAMEIYILKPVSNGTELTVELDSNDEFANYFTEVFPKALENVKQIAESDN